MKYYITTSIVYTNAFPHIGFALELLQADVLARYKRQQGFDVYFLTGTDEHGSKIAKAAQERGKTPTDFVHEITNKYKELTEKLNISNDDFIQTTDKNKHWPGVELMWKKINESGDIYKKKYKGLYCIGCEAFKKEKELIGGKCPDHKKEPELVEEENYFFKLSRYNKKIKELIKNDEVKIIPEHKKREMLNFLSEGLEDISVSRNAESLKWGIPVPGDNSQTLYVWIDALTNYISALGYGRDEKDFQKYWPADIHCVGKDILRFHAIIWIGMLLSAGIDVPHNILVHGHITTRGSKMSKSLGNVIDPFDLINKYDIESVRYYLLREIPTTGDGDFSDTRFIERYNGDLADGIGNLVSRIISLASSRHSSPVIASEAKQSPEPPSCHSERSEESLELPPLLNSKQEEYHQAMKEFRLSNALENIWQIIHLTDNYIEEKKPWEKKEENKEVIDNLLHILEVLAQLIEPFLPQTAEDMQECIKTKQKKNLFPKKQH